MSSSVRHFLPHVSVARPVFLCCDVQTSFRRVMPRFDDACFVARRFLQYHNTVACEHSLYVATEQVPAKLGALDPSIGVPPELTLPKSIFSMITPEVEQRIAGRDTFVLFGIEAHVCVLQTVEDLLARQKRVFLAADGTWSQRDMDREFALAVARDAGAIVSTSESILLQLTRDAADPGFRAVSALLKQKPQQGGIPAAQ
jgi:hypothetical protein